MGKALKTIGLVAGAVALVATGVGLAYGGIAAAATAGTAGAAAGAATAASALSIAAYAGIAAGVANLGATLTYSQKPPRAQGSITQVIIDPDAPQPYVMGEGYVAGILRHDCAYGATLKKVPNPYRWMVMTYSGCGPVASITPYVDQGAVPSWYNTYLITATRLGAVPDTILTPAFGTAPGWNSSTAGLSGYASIGWSLKFDKEGTRFASGLPQLGAYGQWVKVYDPRLDSTYPGGSGSQRLGIESTYAWSANPALHAAMYAYGRYQNSKRVFGMGLDSETIDWAAVVAWANVCDSNGWTIFGRIFEPVPETRWPNLQEICAAGGAKPIVSGGTLTFHYNAPRVVLDTFTEADLADGERSVTAMMSRRRRVNTIVPKYRSPDHNWELVAAADAVTSATYVTEDGETRKAEWPFNLVKDVDQAAELAAYELANGRELTPITLTFGDRVRAYKPGDCIHLDITLKKNDGSDDTVLDLDAVILTRQRDHASQTTTFTFISETSAKHAFALGQSGTAPASPTITPQTGEERDGIAAGTLSLDFGVNANDRNALTPSTPGGMSGNPSISRTFDSGNVTLSHTFTFTASADPEDQDSIDGFELGVWTADTSAAHTMGTSDKEQWTIVAMDLSASSFSPNWTGAIDVAANKYYTLGVRAVRKVHPDIEISGWKKSAIRQTSTPYRPASTQNFTGNINGTTAPTITTAVDNFNADNDGNATQPSAPTSVTVSSTTYPDSTASVGVSWTFTESSDPSAANSIDGYFVGLRVNSTSGGYTYNAADDYTIRWQTIKPLGTGTKRANWNGLPANYYYTGIVIPFRYVRSDVNPANIVLGTPGQSSAVTPHRPSSTVNFTGKIASEDASNVTLWAGYANNGLNADGTIRAGRIDDPSALIAGIINEADWAAQAGTITLGTSDGFDSTYLTVESTGTRLRVEFLLDFQVEVTDPSEGDEFEFYVELWAERVSTGTDYRSSDAGELGGVFSVSEVWTPATASGSKTFSRGRAAFRHDFDGLPTGDFNIGYRLTTDANTAVNFRAYRYLRAEDLRAAE